MASKKEFEMLFQLNASTGSGFAGAFNGAQQQILALQKDIEALNRTQADISAYQKQQQAVENTKNKLTVLQQQYDNIQKEIQETEGYSSSLENKLLSKQQQIEKTAQSLDKETQKLDEMGNALNAAGVDTSNLTSESAKLSGKIEELKNKQTETAEGATKFGEQSAAAFGAIQEAIVAAGIVAALKEIYEAYKECISIAADFEEVMSTVEAISGASASEMGQLSEFAKELGASTKFTAIESGEAMSYMAMAGWDAQQMMSGMDGVLQLAAASGEDLAIVSDIVTDNLTAFGMAASDTAHFSDVLAAAASNSNTSVAIMGETFKNCAALAGALDYSVEDVAVAIGLMANAGIKGSNAGTALKNVFNGLLSGVTLTSEAFGDVTYSAINADGTMKSFGQTMEELRGYFDQMTGAEKMQNAEALAGQRAMAGFVSIMNSSEDDFNKLTDNINNCAGAAKQMADIKMDNLKGQMTLLSSASDALKTTLGEAFAPALRKLAEFATKATTALNNFAKAHPGLTKAVVAFVAVLGAAVAGIVAFVAITKVAIPLMGLLTAAIPGVNVIMGVAVAVAAVTAAIVGLAGAAKSEEQEVKKLTQTSQEHYRELKNLEGEYKAVCEAQGETSEAAHVLKGKVEEAREAFESSKQTFEEWRASIGQTSEHLSEIGSDYEEAVTKIDQENASVVALIGRLNELVTADDGAASSQAEILAIIQELNEEFPELNLNYEDVINNTGGILGNLQAIAEKENKRQKAQESWKAYKKALGEIEPATKKAAEAQENYEKAVQKVKEAEDDASASLNASATDRAAAAEYYGKYQTSIQPAEEELKNYKDVLDEATAAQDAAQQAAHDYLQEYMEASGITMAEADANDQLASAVANVANEIAFLTNSYKEAYDAALESFNGQFALFDTAQADAGATVAAAQAALDSQLNFWNTYAANCEILKGKSAEDLGLTQTEYEVLMAQVQSGTEEAAGLAQSLVNNIDSGNTEAVTKLGKTITEVQTAREKAAGEIADWQTDFSAKMQGIVDELGAKIEEMDKSSEAAAAAKSTIEAYAQNIREGTGPAVTAANELADSVVRAIESRHPTITVTVKEVGATSGKQYASGTDNAARGIALVGENGPELVYFGGGETVIPARETAELIKYYGSDITGYAQGTANAAEITQIVSFLPLMQNVIEAMRSVNTASEYRPIEATEGGHREYHISIAPSFTVNGGDSDIEGKLRGFADEVVREVMDALDEAGIDAKRGAYV